MAADKGLYKAVLKNKAGQCETNAAELTLTVEPKILRVLKDVETQEGKPLELTCEVSGTPQPIATWLKDGTSLTDAARYTTKSSNNVHSLRIENVAENIDSGVYTVRFANAHGTSETKSNVTILIAPIFLLPLADTTTGYLTKTSEFVVQVRAKPAPKLKCLKDNKELVIKDNFKIEATTMQDYTTQYKLLVDNVLEKDKGAYKLEVSNKCGTESSQTDFQVKGSPVFVRLPLDINVLEKKSAKLECEVLGIPIPNVEWYKDGILIEKSSRYVLTNWVILVFIHVKKIAL